MTMHVELTNEFIERFKHYRNYRTALGRYDDANGTYSEDAWIALDDEAVELLHELAEIIEGGES